MADWYDELSAGEREYVYAYGSVLLCEAKEALDAGNSERTEAWVSRLPVGGQLLTKWLHQLDLIVSPRDQDYEEHLRRVISGYDAKQRKFLRRLLDTRAYRSIPIGEWERFNKDNLVGYTHGAPGPIKPEFRDPISRILGELDVQDSDST